MDVSGTASGGIGNTVAVTVAVGEVLEPVSNSRSANGGLSYPELAWAVMVCAASGW